MSNPLAPITNKLIDIILSQIVGGEEAYAYAKKKRRWPHMLYWTGWVDAGKAFAAAACQELPSLVDRAEWEYIKDLETENKALKEENADLKVTRRHYYNARSALYGIRVTAFHALTDSENPRADLEIIREDAKNTYDEPNYRPPSRSGAEREQWVNEDALVEGQE